MSLRSLESLGYLELFVADISTWSFGYLEYFVTTGNTPATKWKPGFMLHELVFLGCHSQFASYPYTFASYSHVIKFYNFMLRISTDKFQCNIFLYRCFSNATRQQVVVLYKQLSVRPHQTDTCESA